jgi:hypothetical protein
MAIPVEAIWSSDFIDGAGGPGGVREPWGKAEKLKNSQAEIIKIVTSAR